VLALFALTLSGYSVAGELAGEWPQFRGPRRDGLSAATDLLDTWPDSGPPEVWRVPIGTGYSGMALVGGRLFTMDADDDAEFAVCLDATTGQELWRTPIGPLFESFFGNGPRSTPTVDGDRVYVLGGRGRLAALRSSDGEILWTVDFPEAFGSAIPEYGFSTSALVVEDLLIVQPGGKKGGAVAALDKRTAEVRWTVNEESAGYSSPLLVEVDGLRQLVVMTPTDLLGVSPGGEVLWALPFAVDQDIKPAMPVFVAPDLLFFSVGYDVGSIALRLEVQGASVLVGEYLYGFDNSTLKCIRGATGEQRWAERGDLGKGSLIYADGHLIVLTESGKLKLVEATPEEYRERAEHRVLSGRCWTSPTLASGRLFLRNRDEMVCLDLRS
jgi:outer membrane protein assembly factor BamB